MVHLIKWNHQITSTEIQDKTWNTQLRAKWKLCKYFLEGAGVISSGSIFCLLLKESSDYGQPITGQVTEVSCTVIGRTQPELTSSKRQKMGPGLHLKITPPIRKVSWTDWHPKGYNSGVLFNLISPWSRFHKPLIPANSIGNHQLALMLIIITI